MNLAACCFGDLADGKAKPSTAAASSASSRDGLVFFGSIDEGRFELEQLLRATAEVLGRGDAGYTYRASLETGKTVVVKRPSYVRRPLLPDPELLRKVEAIGALRHPNLVPLRAYYRSRDEYFLVFDYMSKGSLSLRLYGKHGPDARRPESVDPPPLDWNWITGIALGVAGGVYGGFKMSNILLAGDEDDARISDHGLAGLFEREVRDVPKGYRAPEIDDGGEGGFDRDADVYRFGVLLVDLLGEGRSPAMEILKSEGVDLMRWIASAKPEDWAAEVVDPELLRSAAGESGGDEEGILDLLRLAVECGARRPGERPAMADVVARIERIRRRSGCRRA